MFKTYKNATRIFFVASFFLLTTSCVYKQSRTVVNNVPLERSTSDSNQQEMVNNDAVKDLSSAEFKRLIMDFDASPNKWQFKGSRPVVIDFYATWCGPCRQMVPVFDKVASQYASQVDFYRVDVDKEDELAEWMQISSIPTLMFIPVKGEPNVSIGGMQEDELKSYISNIIATR